MAEDHLSDHSRLSKTEDNLNSPDELSGSTAPALVEPVLLKEPPVKSPRQWNDIWESLLRLGLGEFALRAGTIIASIALVLLVLWVMGSFYLKGDVAYPHDSVVAAPLPTETATVPPPPYQTPAAVNVNRGIPRFAQIHTTLPNRTRVEIAQYEVQKGDTIFGISEKFGLKPQSILWGNFDVLADDPHRLQPGQKLNVLPVDGVLYEWHAGDGLNGVSKFFGVTPNDIINWPGNELKRGRGGRFRKPKH